MSTANHKYDGVFQKFRLGLQNWCRTGKEPAVGDQDIKYYLDLQEKRLQDHDLTVELHIQPDQEIISIHESSERTPILGSMFARFNKSLYAQYVTRSVTFSRGGKKLLQNKKYLTMYQTILDPDPGDKALGQTPYVCPNCGSISSLEVLQDTGCPYCGTRYLMKDLYPKVTNYYFIDSGTRSEKKWKTDKTLVLVAAGCTSFAQLVYTVLTDAEFDLLWAVPSLLLGFFIWTLVIYFVYSIGLLIWATTQAGKAISLMGATAGSKTKITRKLQEYDPAFNYEYFEGKALSLARILMLSQHPEDCVQYQGPKLSDCFSDVVDIQYRGGIGVRQIRKTQERIEVELDLYLTNTLDRGGKLRQKDEKIRIKMYHNADFPVDRSFSIIKVQCPNCGSSFDARKGKNCPYCDQPYDTGIDDWVVTKISR